jgi:hypothetical protein
MHWTLAHPLSDAEDIVWMADTFFGTETDGILTRDKNIFKKNVTIATTVQLFDKNREFIAVCRTDDERLLGYCWFDRGGYTAYAREEISNAKFHHVDLSLPVKTRVKLIHQMIDQHILWANMCGIPVVCSTSIRAENDGFMKIHKKRGFVVNGSYAWIRTEEGMKCLMK